jgi:hypothetical protein
MAINQDLVLSGLSTYVDQIGKPEILIESVFSSTTSKLVNVQTGVKGTQAINFITSTPVYTAADCGLIASTGSVTFGQTNITANDIMQEESICQVGAASLSKYWTGVLQPKGINQEELTPANFAKAFVADKTNKMGNYIDHLVWVGSTGTASQQFSNSTEFGPNGLKLTNGFLYQLNYGTGYSSVVSATWSGAVALTSANAIDVIQRMIGQVPQAVANKELTLFMSLANYRTVVNALLDKQTFNSVFFVKDNDGGSLEWAFKWPYTFNVTVVATNGLEGLNDLVLAPSKDYFFIGTDGEHDSEEFKMWYSADYNAMRFRAMFRMGTAIVYPQYVVYQKGR